MFKMSAFSVNTGCHSTLRTRDQKLKRNNDKKIQQTDEHSKSEKHFDNVISKMLLRR